VGIGKKLAVTMLLVVLVGCLTAETASLTEISFPSAYNPAYDLNHDGIINIYDVVTLTSIYGSEGNYTPTNTIEITSWDNPIQNFTQLITLKNANLHVEYWDWNTRSSPQESYVSIHIWCSEDSSPVTLRIRIGYLPPPTLPFGGFGVTYNIDERIEPGEIFDCNFTLAETINYFNMTINVNGAYAFLFIRIFIW
jgi:hypothetical protein